MDETRHFSSFIAQWNYYFSEIALEIVFIISIQICEIFAKAKNRGWWIQIVSVKLFKFLSRILLQSASLTKFQLKKPKNCLVYFFSGHSIEISTRISVRILQPSKLVSSIINFLETIIKLQMIYKNQWDFRKILTQMYCVIPGCC